MKPKLDHCVITVTDWERSNRFYHDVLGAELVRFPHGWAYRFGDEQLNIHGPGQDGEPNARIPVPARVPVGTYRAETYLISGGRVIAVASRDVQIRKAGFERFVALAAERHGFLYGLTAVMLSLILGYGASALFRRR